MTAYGLLLTVALASDPGASSIESTTRSIVVPHALVSPREEARLPALRAGRLQAFDAFEGEEVSAEQSLARIDAQEANARAVAASEAHLAAMLEAESSLRVRASEHAAKLAELERRLTAQVVAEAPRAVTAVEREETVVKHEQALLQTELERQALLLARHEAAMRGAELEVARIDLMERSLVAPFAGVVVERLVKANEWVQQGEPVIHLMRMDVLQVEAFLDVAAIAPSEVEGLPAELIVGVGPSRHVSFLGAVTFVSPILEADGAYRVRIDVTNRRERDAWLLRPGMIGELTIATPVPPHEIRPAGDGSPPSPTVEVSGPRPSAAAEEPAPAENGDGSSPATDETPSDDSEEPVATSDLIPDFGARTELALDDEIAAALALESSSSDETRDETPSDEETNDVVGL